MASPSIMRRIRQNHALEHATVHMLALTGKPLRLVGRSDWDGFWLYGDVDTESVRWAVEQGLGRLRSGESDLAVHPRCGTNIASAAMLSIGAVYAAASLSGRSPALRALRVTVALFAALVLSRPFGLAVQRHITTDATVQDLWISDIQCSERAGLVVHRVLVAQEQRSEGYVLHTAR